MSEIDFTPIGTLPAAQTRIDDLAVVVVYQRETDTYLIAIYPEIGRPSVAATYDLNTKKSHVVHEHISEREQRILDEAYERVVPGLAASLSSSG